MDLSLNVRLENYLQTEPHHVEQDEKILSMLYLLKQAGASKLYNHLKRSNNGEELYPLTSIRRSLNTLKNDNKIIDIGRGDSELYNSTETIWKPKQFQNGLF